LNDSELSPQQKLLLAMHNTGAIMGKSGKSVEELAELTGIPKEEIPKLIADHTVAGYLGESVDEGGVRRYFLTGRGIIRVSSLFT
jgi:hypothetical protein